MFQGDSHAIAAIGTLGNHNLNLVQSQIYRVKVEQRLGLFRRLGILLGTHFFDFFGNVDGGVVIVSWKGFNLFVFARLFAVQ